MSKHTILAFPVVIVVVLFLATAVVLSLWRPGVSHAQGSVEWHPQMPPSTGDSVSAFAIDPTNPDRIWIATQGTGGAGSAQEDTYLYRSDDGGQHWSILGGELPDNCYYAGGLHVHSDGQHLAVAGCPAAGLFLSDDGGVTWHQALWGQSVVIVQVAAADPTVLYVVLESPQEPAGENLGFLYRSDDGGETWQPADAGLPGRPWGLSVHPEDPHTVYATFTTGDERLWRSRDGGVSWQPLSSAGLPVTDGQYGRCVSGLVIHPFAPDTLWVTLLPANSLGGCEESGGWLYRSTNGGASWTMALADVWSTTPIFDPTTPQILYVATLGDGLYQSVDGGNTWAKRGDWPAYDRYAAPTVGVDLLDPSVLYAPRGRTLYVSSDQGRSWSTTTMPSYVDDSITPHPQGGLLAGGQGGLYRSSTGQVWQVLGRGLPPGNRVTTLAVDPATSMVLYAGLESYSDSDEVPLVWRSDDAGVTWTPAQSGVTLDAQVQSLLVDPSSPVESTTGTASAYVSVEVPPPVYATLADVGRGEPPAVLLRSTDGGLSWQPADSGLPEAVYGLAHDGTALYVGTRDGVYKSTDQAQSWTATDPIFTDTAVVHTDIDALIASDGTIYAGVVGRDNDGNFVESRIVRSTDGGQTWQTGSGYPTDVGFRRLLRTSAGLYVRWHRSFSVGGSQVEERGMHRSMDGGATWVPFSYPGCAQPLGPTAEGGLWYSMSAGAVLQSDAAGTVWTPRSAGLRGSGALTALSAARDTVYAGTMGGELFKSSDRGGSWQYLPLNLQASHVGPCSVVDDIGQVVIHPLDPERVYVGMEGFCGAYGGGGDGLFRSNDGGQSWDHPLANGCVQDVAVSRQAKELLWVLLETGGIRYSDDSGATWEAIDVPGNYAYQLAVHPKNPSILLVATTGGTCLYRTVDGGATWEGVLSESPPCGLSDTINDLAFNQHDPDVVYAGDHVSYDAGLTWQASTDVPTDVTFDPGDPLRAYSRKDGDLYRSLDGGQSWAALGAWPTATPGVGVNATVAASAVGWAEAPRLYAFDCDTAGLCRFWSTVDGRPYGVWVPLIRR